MAYRWGVRNRWWGVRNRVSHPNLGILTKIIAETRFLGLGAGAQKPGFFPQSWWGCRNYRRNPVSWIRNRVSFLNLGGDAEIIAETRFLGLGAGAQKPGFFLNLGGDAKIVAETRFLGLGAGTQKPGFFLNLGGDAKIVAETRFLGLTSTNPGHITSVFFKCSRQRIITA
ncbi:MAG: hypothetical protein JGK24_14665 [Microcoleus sp. PH2017_29_MFU_D_A]|uniref:hypothetical protein n=1 Tax=Microcoleus sp. PH2017_29_MFU_D_A TaxID=2798839 RepID=UPI001E06A73F|nr:hypothetical protein [Microcoleus sp. PH2017_29_MFU_D_A]MCC3604426.1 hypothetical protein [Microcoleus sp. PH2017_29_MFU_D_A]